FPSHVYHQVTPVTRGTRYSLVLWAMGQPFR
ncbi:2OG-Fe(II) oxygenase, partial [bacterium]|nr:2OG-Fe(II) oxygenase [bacterium]